MYLHETRYKDRGAVKVLNICKTISHRSYCFFGPPLFTLFSTEISSVTTSKLKPNENICSEKDQQISQLIDIKHNQQHYILYVPLIIDTLLTIYFLLFIFMWMLELLLYISYFIYTFFLLEAKKSITLSILFYKLIFDC